jgi:hypothetical protein
MSHRSAAVQRVLCAEFVRCMGATQTDSAMLARSLAKSCRGNPGIFTLVSKHLVMNDWDASSIADLQTRLSIDVKLNGHVACAKLHKLFALISLNCCTSAQQKALHSCAPLQSFIPVSLACQLMQDGNDPRTASVFEVCTFLHITWSMLHWSA